MLLRPDGDGVVAVGQASHAWLSGQLARAWGNARFPAPQPWEEVCLGAEQHDVGMALWDLAPERHPDTGYPRQFFQLERRTHLRLWGGAAQRMLTQSRYAALLVSLHGTGLYERFPPQTGDPEVARAVQAFLDDQRALQERLIVELGADRERLRVNQALLAAWDDLSLAICQDRAPHDVPGVPSADGPLGLSLDRHPDGAALTLDPWPFAAGEVALRAEGRRLDGPSASEAELHAALERAPVVAVHVVLRRRA